jgi:hypothetical protein
MRQLLLKHAQLIANGKRPISMTIIATKHYPKLLSESWTHVPLNFAMRELPIRTIHGLTRTNLTKRFRLSGMRDTAGSTQSNSAKLMVRPQR